jgi:hypothetical protein
MRPSQDDGHGQVARTKTTAWTDAEGGEAGSGCQVGPWRRRSIDELAAALGCLGLVAAVRRRRG